MDKVCQILTMIIIKKYEIKNSKTLFIINKITHNKSAKWHCGSQIRFS